MPSVSLGKIAFSYKQTYDPAAIYARQDVVTLEGDSYVCLIDGSQDRSPLLHPSHWQLFAQGTAHIASQSGELIYHDGARLAALAVGSAGQVLTVNAQGLPMGMQLIGRPQGDAALLRLAAAYEQVIGDWLAVQPAVLRDGCTRTANL